MKVTLQNATLISAMIYTSTSLLAALAFFAAAAIDGNDWVGRIGGAVWVFALMMVILMPTVTPIVMARGEKSQAQAHDQDAM